VLKYSCFGVGHPVDVHDNRGWMAIHEASDGNFIDCLSYLLQQGIIPNHSKFPTEIL